MRMKASLTNRGFTLTEISFVLGIVGLVTAGVWSASSGTRQSQISGDAVSELQIISQNIEVLMSGNKFNTLGNITSSMITAKAIPVSYLTSPTATTINNPWEPAGLVIYADTATTFRIAFLMPQGLSQKYVGICANMISAVTSCSPKQVGCPVKIAVAGAAIPANDVKTPDPTIGWQGLTAAQMEAFCGLNNYINNDIEFSYSL